MIINSYYTAIYQAGMLILGLLCKQDVSEVYDYQHYQINMFKLASYIQDLYSSYTADIVDMVKKMLDPNPFKRPEFQDLLKKHFQVTTPIEYDK